MAALIRFGQDPFAGLTSLHSQLDDMFNDFLRGSSLPSGLNMPAMDVYNDGDKQLVAEVQVPGFDKDDIEINVHNGVLEIKGEKKTREEDKDKKRTYMVRESSSSFYRRIALPKHADGDNITAKFDDGMLRLAVPFRELPKPKRVEISAGKSKAK